MKMYQFVCNCGDMNVSLTISEVKIRSDYSMNDEDKDEILALKSQVALPLKGTYLGSFTDGKPFAVRRLS